VSAASPQAGTREAQALHRQRLRLADTAFRWIVRRLGDDRAGRIHRDRVLPRT